MKGPLPRARAVAGRWGDLLERGYATYYPELLQSVSCRHISQPRIPLHPRCSRPPHFAEGTPSSVASFSLASEFSGFFSSAFL
jgi:hypothetical protein